MLNGLDKPHAKEFKALLLKVAFKYPQAIFYELNNYIQQRTRVSGRANTNSLKKPTESPTSALAHAQVIMADLNKHHAPLYCNLNRMVESLGKNFMFFPEEELVALLHDVLLQCYGGNYIERKYKIWKMLQTIYEIFFTMNNSGEIVDPDSKFCKKFKVLFQKELLSDTPEEMHIPLLIGRLKTFISRLDAAVNKIPNSISLEKLAPFLSSFQNDSVQIPGQFTSIMEPNPDDYFLIDKFESQVTVNKSYRFPRRMISMRGSNGEVFNFFIENNHRKPPPLIPKGPFEDSGRVAEKEEATFVSAYDVSWDSEYRFAKLLRHFNGLFKKTNMQARKRHIYIFVSKFIPISPNTRLVAAPEEELVPYEDVYRRWCSANGKEFEAPLEYIRNSIEAENLQNVSHEQRVALYTHISEHIISPSIFKEYVLKRLGGDLEGVWHFKKHFFTQLAVSTLMSYLFSTDKNTLFNTAFTPKSAQIFNFKFFPQYDSNGMLLQSQFVPPETEDVEETLKTTQEYKNNIPFLLSNNMHFFMCPTFKHSIYSIVMLTSLLTLGESDLIAQTKDRLRLFFQDDLYDWMQKSSLPLPGNMNMIDLVEENTNSVSKKILALTPEVRPDMEVNSSVPIDTTVSQLINTATDVNSLSSLDPTLFPWF
uniref:Uncharacterized protein n=1 Tax=Arcella intermedia TaxID=1963864 RepID=A0A6B2KZ67_9EUKA